MGCLTSESPRLLVADKAINALFSLYTSFILFPLIESMLEAFLLIFDSDYANILLDISNSLQ